MGPQGCSHWAQARNMDYGLAYRAASPLALARHLNSEVTDVMVSISFSGYAGAVQFGRNYKRNLQQSHAVELNSCEHAHCPGFVLQPWLKRRNQPKQASPLVTDPAGYSRWTH